MKAALLLHATAIGKKSVVTNLMLENLLPKTITNNYLGKSIAKWVFVAMTVLTIARSLAHIFLPDGGAQSIATIPLDAYSRGASAVIIGMFAQWGLTQLMLGLLYVLVLWRYQSLIPLMWLFITFEWSGRLLLGFIKPFETVGTAPGAIGNLIIPLLALIMLVLSLRTKKIRNADDNSNAEDNYGLPGNT